MAVVFTAFGVGTYTGWRAHQASIHRKIRKLIPSVPAAVDKLEPEPIDHDAIYRVLKQFGPGEP